ncbi:MAG TPA: Uma2 family endonuclease [Gemmataceae bacterium]|nr:Uma2 family endonuclease [Gemmataceae bacterium]
MAITSGRPRSGRCLLLHDIDWSTYSRLLRVFAERSSMRLTYDRGALEIMAPLHEHESDADFLGRLVVVLTEELGLPIKAGGSTTLRRRRRRRGLEPDRCYWIVHEPQVRGKRRIDLRTDPPPDLAIEVDVPHSSLDRMAIYAALGVPEVWRRDTAGLTFTMLGSDGACHDSGHSQAFAFVTPADLTRVIAQRAGMDENAVVVEFRKWVQQRKAGTGTPAP